MYKSVFGLFKGLPTEVTSLAFVYEYMYRMK